MTIKGKPFLSLPTDEVIGTICGHPITLGNKIPHPNGRYFGQGGRSDQVIRMRWDDELTGARVRPDNVDTFLKLLEITPSIDHQGIDSLHVLLADRPRIHIGRNGFDYTPRAKRRSAGPTSAAIPEIRFRIRATTQAVIGTRTLVVPVHLTHVN